MYVGKSLDVIADIDGCSGIQDEIILEFVRGINLLNIIYAEDRREGGSIY